MTDTADIFDLRPISEHLTTNDAAETPFGGVAGGPLWVTVVKIAAVRLPESRSTIALDSTPAEVTIP